MPERWFDTHVHLERYNLRDQHRLVHEARAAGVEGMLAVSTSLASSERTLALELPVPRAVGVHPTRADDFDPDRLRALAGHDSVVAIGECGFDDSGPDWDLQHGAFEAQAAAARDLVVPLILHIDGPAAWEQFLDASATLEGIPVIRHYFSGEEHQARFHADRGHFVSFGRPVIREPEQQRVARLIPLDLLLIETDSYPLPNRTTEPKSLPEVGETLARALNIPVETCSQHLWTNTTRALARLATRN